MYRRGMSAVSRRDPFCAYFVGSAGIGKSVLASEFSCDILDSQKIPYSGEPIFTLPSGAKYWNGCRHQPVILIDDFLAVQQGQLLEESIRALFEIKSCAVLNPPMAALEDKELRYCPEAVVILSNHAFPAINHADATAVLRRRDLLVEVALCDVLENAGLRRISDMTLEELKNVFNIDSLKQEHLKFRIAGDVCGGEHHNSEGAQWSRWMDYADFKRRACNAFKQHRDSQMEIFAKKKERFEQYLAADVAEPEELFKKVQEYKRTIEMLTVLEPKKNCDFKDYLKLVQYAVSGGPITDEKLRDLVEIRVNTLERIRKIQERGQHEAPTVHNTKEAYYFLDMLKDFCYYRKKTIEIKRKDTTVTIFSDIKNYNIWSRYVANKLGPKLRVPKRDIFEIADAYCQNLVNYQNKTYLERIRQGLNVTSLLFDTPTPSSQPFACLRDCLKDYEFKGIDELEFKTHFICEASKKKSIVDRVRAWHESKRVSELKMKERVRKMRQEMESEIYEGSFDEVLDNRYESQYHVEYEEEDDLPYEDADDWSEEEYVESYLSDALDEFFNEICADKAAFIGDDLEYLRKIQKFRDSPDPIFGDNKNPAYQNVVFKTIYTILTESDVFWQNINHHVYIMHALSPEYKNLFGERYGSLVEFDSVLVGGIMNSITLLYIYALDADVIRDKCVDANIEDFAAQVLQWKGVLDSVSLGMFSVIEDELKKVNMDIKKVYKDFNCIDFSNFKRKPCRHCYWNPDALYRYNSESKVGLWHILRNEQVLVIPDEVCEDYCIWKDEEYYRLCMRWFKHSNPVQYKTLVKLEKHEQPKFIRESFRVDTRFWKQLLICLGIGFSFFISLCIVLATIVCVLYCIYLILSGIVATVGWALGAVSTTTAAESVIGASFATGIVADKLSTPHNSPYTSSPKMAKNVSSKIFGSFFKSSAPHNGPSTMGDSIIPQVQQSIYFVQGNNLSAKFRIIALGDRLFLWLLHYKEILEHYKSDFIVVTKFKDPNFKININISDLQFYPNQDGSIVLCEFPNVMPCQRHIYKRIRPALQNSNSLQEVCFMEALDDSLLLRPIVPTHKSGVVIEGVSDKGISEITLHEVLSYDVGGFGKCGSPIIDLNRGQIIAFHVAGRDGSGYAEYLNYEAIQPFFIREKYNPLEPSSTIDHLITPVNKLSLDGEFVTIGIMDAGLKHHNSSETQLQHTLIAGVYPITHEPAPLKKCDPRVPIENYSPLIAGVSNMLRPTIDFPTEILEVAAESLSNKIILECKPFRSKVGVLTYNEAICGIPSLKYYDGIDMTTSEGFPLARFRPGHAQNKSWLFKFEELPDRRQLLGWRNELDILLKMEQENRDSGKVNRIIHDDCLKDAKISKSKISTPGKTRIFSTSPITFTIVFKQYFTDFLAAFKNSRIKLSHAVGINPNSCEWRNVVSYLMSSGFTKILTGDYKNFGPSLNSRCVRKSFEIIINWYDKYENDCGPAGHEYRQKIRRILAEELINAHHLCGSLVYQTLCGLPSGNPATVEINCLVNELYIMCAFIEMGRQQNFKYFCDHYFLHTRLLVYGDDLIMSVSDEVATWFNNQNLITFFDKYKIGYTDASKKDVVRPYQSLQESIFLKRGFKPHPNFKGEWLAPLDWESVTDTANWCHSYLTLEEGTKCSAIDSVCQAYGHGPEIYEQHRQKISKALTSVGIFASIRTWSDWDRINFPEYYS